MLLVYVLYKKDCPYLHHYDGIYVDDGVEIYDNEMDSSCMTSIPSFVWNNLNGWEIITAGDLHMHMPEYVHI
jgi:hypothetical protein